MTTSFPTKLLWVDLEMTGLVPHKDVLLEVAVLVTDFDFNVLETYEQRIAQDRSVVEVRMDANPWWKDYPGNRKQFVKKLTEGKPLADVQADLVALTRRHFGHERAMLAGNSIYNDRMFIKQWLPELESTLHYRMLDVSSFKILMQGRYGHEFKKQSMHRALDDIQASIAELREYLIFLHDAPKD
ncbi:oligoribonuclease [Candidatus Saccharibacteria bacterium]|nr:oligoribonuclease [Candidatus Saccharibacteria bacterium]